MNTRRPGRALRLEQEITQVRRLTEVADMNGVALEDSPQR